MNDSGSGKFMIQLNCAIKHLKVICHSEYKMWAIFFIYFLNSQKTVDEKHFVL